MGELRDVSALRTPPALLREMFDAAVAAAQPACVVPRFLPDPPKGRLVVLGAGKASAAMARAVEDHWSGELEGLVVTRYGHGVPCNRIEVLEAAHPVPDAAGLDAAKRILRLAEGLGSDDLALCLISGGGSALLTLPQVGLTLEDKQSISRSLLVSGASIREMNIVRRHLSAIKGGRLAAACHPARVVSLLISDVPGDDASDVASGPTVADSSTCADALDVLQRYRISVPARVVHLLESGSGETIKRSDPRLALNRTHVIATPRQSLIAAAAVARRAGLSAHILGDAIEGEARDVGSAMAEIALKVAGGKLFETPCVLLSGGETTVTVRGAGRGGRNVEFLLALAIALQSHADVYALAADTDGFDGAEEVAGAIISPDTLRRSWTQGMNPIGMLAENDAHTFFERLDDQVVTGPTHTNVNDFRALLILPSAR